MVSVYIFELVAAFFHESLYHSLCFAFHNPGTCMAAGYRACCEIGFCAGYPASCFCDYDCHQRGDCCHDISTTCAESMYIQTNKNYKNKQTHSWTTHKHTQSQQCTLQRFSFLMHIIINSSFFLQPLDLVLMLGTTHVASLETVLGCPLIQTATVIQGAYS